MMRMVQSKSAGQAKEYFSDELSKSDYYVNDQELQGQLMGRLAEHLGVSGPATKEAFFALCENQVPGTGKPLTPRKNEGRTVGYDINFHCPKSVSVLHILSKDDHILDAFQKSVTETMKDIEADSKTTVRKGGEITERKTGEMIWANFIHQTARPIEGELPDPHLHAHAFLFNATFDRQERRVKAAQFRDIMRDMPYYQARFHKRLADKLVDLGYQVRRTDYSFEVEGVPKKVIEHFSKRTDEIGRIAKEKGITDAKQLDALGAKTRAKKQKGLSMTELKAQWRKDMEDLNAGNEHIDNQVVRFGREKIQDEINPAHCVDHAVKHRFERASVMAERRLLETAFRQAIGRTSVSLDDIEDRFDADARIIRIAEGSRQLCTTPEVLLEEQKMVQLARMGQGQLSPLYRVSPAFLQLKGQQADAAKHVLTTRNRVAIVRGAAGTGKTMLMKETVDLIKQANKRVYVVAPTAEASRGVLRSEGFNEADTVAKFLNDKETHKKLDNQVIWVDEAGLLGTKDMTALLELATKKNARLILGGDTRQHTAVVRGDALRILNTVGGIKAAEVSEIYRQKDANYKAAVEDLSKGNIKDAFEKLESMGSIKTVDVKDPNAALVDDYVAALKKKKSALIVSPTHKQGDDVTDAVRQKLRQARMIGKKEVKATRYSNLNMTAAEKADCRNYREGQAITFNQNMRGIKRGSVWTVKAVDGQNVKIGNKDGKTMTLPRNKAEKFDVFHKTEIGLSKGDKVRVTRNGFDEKEKRLNNGLALEVVKVSKKGKILLRQPDSKTTYTLKSDFGHIAHAHCITSHASQGKTVDEVFISQPSATFPATDMKQFYVSVSRGKQAVKIYTDDKTQLLEHAAEMGDRLSGLELFRRRSPGKIIEQLQRKDYTVPGKAPEPKKEIENRPSPQKNLTDIDYEPEF